MDLLFIISIFYNLAGIVQQKGIDNVTVDDLVEEITPKARGWYVLVYA